MQTEYTARAIIENVNSLPNLSILETIDAVANMIIAMRPPRPLLGWEVYHPYILAHYIMTRCPTPRPCYHIDAYSGLKTPDTRIHTHLMHILGEYPIEQFLDKQFVETLLYEYFRGIIKTHNDSIDLFGRSIFGEWARSQNSEANKWVFNKIIE